MSIKLSILIPTVPSRLDNFYPRLVRCLLDQIGNRNDIEIVALFDNKKRTIGQKRQDLLSLAKGQYLTFIDDDDRIAEDYIETIMKTLDTHPQADCVVFDCICCVNNGPNKVCKYGIEFEYGDILQGLEWRGKPAHTMVYRSAIAKKHHYVDTGYGEDIDWVKRACQDIQNQVRIDKVLYYYDARINSTSETRGLSDAHIQNNIRALKEKNYFNK